MMTGTNQSFRLQRFDAVLGAEITGLNLSKDISPDCFAEIEAAFDHHSVVVIRDQSLTPQQQLDFWLEHVT